MINLKVNRLGGFPGLDFPKETNPLNQSASECHRTTSISRLFCSIFFRMAVHPRGWGKPQQVSAYSLKASSVVCYGLLNHTRVCLKIVKIWKFYKIVMFSLKCSIWGYTGIPHHWTNPHEWISLTTPSQTILTSCNVFRSDFPQAHAVLKISRTVKENKHLSWWSTTAAFWDNTLIQELIMQ